VRVPELRLPGIIAALGVIAGLTLGASAVPVPLRVLAAGALAFVLPGTALRLALLPDGALGGAERIAIGLGGSLAAAIVLAFGLQALPSGLTASSWGAGLGALTLIAGLAAWVRMGRPALAHRPAYARDWDPARPAARSWTSVDPLALLMLVAAGVFVVLALAVARAGVALGPTASFTELWLLPADDGAAVRVGVGNHEGVDETYRLTVLLDGQPLGGPADLRLADGHTTDQLVQLPAPDGRARTVEVRLWTAEQATTDPPDRMVRTTLPPEASAAP